MLAADPFLGGLARLFDVGRLAGRADVAVLRALAPGLLTFDAWLGANGRPLVLAALGVGDAHA